MDFKEIDFHVELYRAYLEPQGAELDYLLMLRKQTKIKKKVFLIKLQDALKNIKESYEQEFYSATIGIINRDSLTNYHMPITFFNRYPKLILFSQSFYGEINKNNIEGLVDLINRFSLLLSLKELKKSLSEIHVLPDIDTKNQKDEGFQSIENKFNQDLDPGIKDHDNANNNLENNKLISINKDVINILYKELSVYFEGFENDLKSILEGKEINHKIYFNSNGNQLTDVFYRLHEKGQILNDKIITAKWICKFFENENQKTGRASYKYDVVYKQLTNRSGGIPSNKRICKDL